MDDNDNDDECVASWSSFASKLYGINWSSGIMKMLKKTQWGNNWKVKQHLKAESEASGLARENKKDKRFLQYHILDQQKLNPDYP